QSKTTRPRPVYLWNVLDVQKWLRRHCSDYYQLYYELFLHVSVFYFVISMFSKLCF
ncbi:AVE protein, partial [Pseudoatta argentina]